MYGEWDPIPWRAVVRAELYAGPRNGLRVRLLFDCGHTMDRVARPDEKADPSAAVTQCTGACYPCWWAAGNSYKAGCGQTHYSTVAGGLRPMGCR